ncbi:MAG TPA: hypothetical protein P5192_05180 [Fervidobacterium sp.]|nr:hypothetical protein [Fervidobacterium sp.]
MIQLLGFIIYMFGIYLNVKINNMLLSKIVQLVALISLGLTISNPFIVVLLTVLLLISRNLYTPVGKELIDDLKRFLFNKSMARSSTYLMLVITGGIFVGFSLPAVKNYPTMILSTTIGALLLIYVVEFSNYKSFEEKIKTASNKNADQIEALKYAYELMHPFSQVGIEEAIVNRIELFKNVRNKNSETSEESEKSDTENR